MELILAMRGHGQSHFLIPKYYNNTMTATLWALNYGTTQIDCSGE